jgi:hypothetical protein
MVDVEFIPRPGRRGFNAPHVDAAQHRDVHPRLGRFAPTFVRQRVLDGELKIITDFVGL